MSKNCSATRDSVDAGKVISMCCEGPRIAGCCDNLTSPNHWNRSVIPSQVNIEDTRESRAMDSRSAGLVDLREPCCS